MARRALGPALLSVVQAVEEFDDVARAARPGATDRAGLLVACSGGPDSLALVAATAVVARRRGRPAAAIVVDHGLQTGSAEVAERAAGRAEALGLPAEVVRVAVTGVGGPEAAAREARHAALRAAADRHDATVLLGHTLDDQAETVLLGLARGSGARALSGMPARRGVFGRPLLGLRRATTVAACVELGLEPWRDPHNADPRFARARVRHAVLPVAEEQLGPGVAEALARSARLLRADADLLDELAGRAYAEAVGPVDGHPGAAGAVEARVPPVLDCARAAALPDALRYRVLRRFLLDGGVTEATEAHVLAADRLITAWRGQHGVDLPGGRLVRRAGMLVLDGPGAR